MIENQPMETLMFKFGATLTGFVFLAFWIIVFVAILASVVVS